MAQLVFKNNAQSTLSGSIAATATALPLSAGTGILFPTPAAGQYFVGTLIDAATGLLNEIVWCTQVVGDLVTIVRGQEGTTPKAWNANDAFAELWTAGQAGQMLQQGQNQAQSSNYGVDVGTPGAVRVVLNPPLTTPTPGMPIRVLIQNSNPGDSTLDPGPGAAQIVLYNGSVLPPAYLVVGMVVEFQWNGTKYELMDPNLTTVAPGLMFPYAGANAPAGWLLCDGASYLRASYANLFAIIGTIYGSVDGTHFNVPDMRGRVPAGLAGASGRLTGASITTPNALGGYGGAEVNSVASSGSTGGGLSVSTSVNVSGAAWSGGENTDSNANSGPGGSFNFPAVTHGHYTSMSSSGSGSGGTSGSLSVNVSSNNFIIVQPTLMVNYVIKV
jgi:microcystin-dependent protein